MPRLRKTSRQANCALFTMRRKEKWAVSLNHCLYAGPTFGQNIIDILLRFRIHQVAVIAYIEKAFLMVSVSEEDHDALRFLWIHDINAQLPRLVILRFTLVVFGVSTSPFLLNATTRRHVEKYRDEDPLFVYNFNRSIYVDDLIFGAKTEDALELFTKARLCVDKVGFTLRKFCIQLFESSDSCVTSRTPGTSTRQGVSSM